MKLKREPLYIIAICLLTAMCAFFYYDFKYQPAHEISVYYNHDEQLNEQAIQLIRTADKYVYFAIYTFTRQDLADALRAAKYRGLTVVGITDRQQYQTLEAQKKIIDSLRNDSIPVYEQDHAGIMHMKALVTEKGYLSGSYNWTQAATNLNDEIVEVGHDETVRNQYEQVLLEVFKKYRTSGVN